MKFYHIFYFKKLLSKLNNGLSSSQTTKTFKCFSSNSLLWTHIILLSNISSSLFFYSTNKTLTSFHKDNIDFGQGPCSPFHLFNILCCISEHQSSGIFRIPLEEGSSNSAPWNFEPNNYLSWGNCPIQCRVFKSIPGLY